MPVIGRNEDISILPLSVRTCNCLRRAQIHTIGAMMDYPDAELLTIRNMGVKSADEVRHWVHILRSDTEEYTLVEYREVPSVSKSDPENLRITDTGLSVRSKNALKNGGIEFVSQLAGLTEAELMAFKNMGRKSASEILAYMAEADIPYQADSNEALQGCAFIDSNGAIAEDLRIADTSLSVRSKNALKNGGVEFVSQLAGLSGPELMAFEHMGVKSVDEILTYMAKVEVTYHTDSTATAMQLPAECQEIISQMVQHFGQAEFTWAQELTEIKDAYPDSCGETLIYRLYERAFTKATVKAAILHLIEKNGGEISRKNLMEQLPSHLGNTTIAEDLLLELERDFAVEVGEIMISRQYPSVVQFVAQLTDDRQREVLEARLAGKTLQEIGDSNGGVSRERIRQVSAKGLAKRPRLREDQYGYIYDHYDFSEDDFLLAFDEPVETYNYLEMVSTQSRSKRKPIEDLLTDTAIPAALRRKAEKAVYKKYITVDGVHVRKRRADLVKHFVKTLCTTLTKFDDFVAFYNDQLRDLGLSNEASLLLEARTYTNTLNNCDYVLWNQWSSFRYYNIPEHDFEELLNTIDLEAFGNAEISSLKLFRDYPELMAQYDIHDEYELHNLLKKIWKSGSVEISFKRMPTIEIGSANATDQLLSLLIQYAPVTADDLAQHYEEEYGVKAGTVRGAYLRELDHYFYNGVYSIHYDALPLDQFERMKQILTKDYYSIQTVKQLYLREFPHSDDSKINPYTLKTLDFHVYPGYSGYIVKNTYAGATDFFNSLLTQTDLVDMRQQDSSIRKIATYDSELYRLRAAYEIVEFSPLQYIHIRRLNAVGITAEDLRNYCQAVAAFYEKGTFFTTTSLYQDGFVHKLDDLGFEEWFYSSVLLEDRKNFSYQRIGGTRIFLCGKANANLGAMLTWVLEQYQKIDFYDLIDLLRDRYGITLPKEKLIEILRGTNLYYDTIMESVYIDYDTYFEEI